MSKRIFVPTPQRKGTHAKDIKKFKAVRLPSSKTRYIVSIPDEYAEALSKKYPELSISEAIRKQIILSIRLVES